MFIPDSFRMEDPARIKDHLKAFPFATIVSYDGDTPIATHIPFVLEETEGGEISLSSHLARANPQAELLNGNKVLVIFQGPHAYISPVWYESPVSVPTWNYISVHVTGSIEWIQGNEETLAQIESLIRQLEPEYLSRWNVLPEKYIQALVSELVAFRIKIDKVECAEKLSQNRTARDRENIIQNLSRIGGSQSQDVAKAMERK